MRAPLLPLAAFAIIVGLILTTASCGNAQDGAEPALSDGDMQENTESTPSGDDAQTDTKRLLSDEIRAVLESDGPEAAKRRFDEIVPDQADRYEFDMQGMSELAMEHMQAGDMQSGQVVYEMVATLTRVQMEEYMPGVAAAARAQQEADREAARQAQANRNEQVKIDRGPARDDLERFAGEYGEPDKQGAGARNLVVGWTCDGYLWLTASWGDASPWHLESVSETKFEHSGPHLAFKIDFEVDDSGAPIAMNHDLDLGLPNRLRPVESSFGEPECLPVERHGR